MNSRQISPQVSVPFVDSIVQGDCRELLPQLPDECLDAVITSPPYYQQRDYGIGDIGNEPSLDAYIQNLLQVFEQCVRCLKPTGSIFFNIGDKYESGSLQLAPYLFANAAVQRIRGSSSSTSSLGSSRIPNRVSIADAWSAAQSRSFTLSNPMSIDTSMSVLWRIAT
jgi:hypothetical protein